MLHFLDISAEALEIVSDNARLPAKSATLSAPPVRLRRDRDAWKRRRRSTDDFEQLHDQSSNRYSRSLPHPNYNRWDASCPQFKTTASTPSLMLLQLPGHRDSIRRLDISAPPRKPIRRMTFLEPSRDTARLIEQALLITKDCAS